MPSSDKKKITVSKMRKRGWSVHSSDHDDENNDEDVSGKFKTTGKRRKRKVNEENESDGDDDDDDSPLSEAEKLALLNSYPTSEPSAISQTEVIDVDSGSDDGLIDLTSDGDGDEVEEPRSKRAKPNEGEDKQTTDHKDKLHSAKKQLSKWAARLFDPNRPRGLIETPEEIPLDDTFLSAFGKREKEFDDKMGRKIDIDRSRLDEDSDTDEEKKEMEKQKSPKLSTKGCTIKITNIGFTTRSTKLRDACERYGRVMEVNLPMDKNKPNFSMGRAFVIFEEPDCAVACIEGMNEKNLDGRALRIMLAPSQTSKAKFERNARYWVNDISSKCRRCGAVGHIEANCTNEDTKPCTICAMPGHDSRACPVAMICFNCGVPGHVARDCLEPRGMPRRVVCGICFLSGHHRWQCQAKSWHINTIDAVCFDCGKLGHFSCADMEWAHSWEGYMCFNCGDRDHYGAQCNRPTLEQCQRNSNVGTKEIEMAYSRADLSQVARNEVDKALGISFMEERNGGGGSQRSRSRRDRDGDKSKRQRAKSQPPPGESFRDFHRGSGDTCRPTPSRGYNQPPPPPPRRSQCTFTPPPKTSRGYPSNFQPPPNRESSYHERGRR